MRRRALLGTLAGTASAAALAGCSGIMGDSSGESDPGSLVADAVRAPYDRYLAADVRQPVYGRDGPGSVGMTFDFTSEPDPRGDASLPGGDDDPDLLVEFGASVASAVQFSIWLAMRRIGLGSLLEEGSGLERIHQGSVPVLVGDFDEDGIAHDLEAAEFARSEPYRNLEVYDAPDSPELVAFDGERIFLGIHQGSVEDDAADGADSSTGPSLRQLTEATVDAASGDRRRTSQAFDPFDDLVTALPERQYMVSGFDADGGLFQGDSDDDGQGEQDGGSIDAGSAPDEIALEGDALGIASAFDAVTESRTETTCYFAIRYADAGEVDEKSAIQEAIAPNAVEPDVAVDGPLAVVSGTYERESVD